MIELIFPWLNLQDGIHLIPLLGIIFFAVHPWYLSYTPTTICPNNLDDSNEVRYLGTDQPFHMTVGWGPIGATQGGAFVCGNYSGVLEFDGGYIGLIFSVPYATSTTMYPDSLPQPIAYDGTIATMTIHDGIVSQSYESGSGNIETMSLSIDKPGEYSVGLLILNSNGDPEYYLANEHLYVTGSGGTIGTPVYMVYGSGSSIMETNISSLNSVTETQLTYDDDSSRYVLVTDKSTVPFEAPATYSVSYQCDTTSSGYLQGIFTGSVNGRISGYVTQIEDSLYTSSYYVDVMSGSFSGSFAGRMCGMFDGRGVMIGNFDAGPIAIASASIDGEGPAPYSGSVYGEISGSITGSICCSVTTEHDFVFPLEFVNLDDNRLRLYYAKTPPFEDSYEVDMIETTPLE